MNASFREFVSDEIIIESNIWMTVQMHCFNEQSNKRKNGQTKERMRKNKENKQNKKTDGGTNERTNKQIKRVNK